MEVKNMNNSKRAVQIDSQQSRRAGRDRLDSNEVMVTRSDRSFVCDNHTSLDRTLALVLGLLYLPFPTASPPMDKVHQSAPGSSNTSERTDLVTRPRAVRSLADRAIPSREQNSSTIPSVGFIAAVRRLPQLDLQLATPPYSKAAVVKRRSDFRALSLFKQES
ncbi:putative MFS-type transporter YcxA [Trichinella spiralis]|uniref:MFS-type transporter YcxA n=1 Tax=Trichinella spiralis TaxID=6334 RepID=A0ABR3K8C8_TRISP